MKQQRIKEVSFILALAAAQACFAGPVSKPIVDVRIDAPYRQIESSNGDEWAPTWGSGDTLYTGNDDGSSFGGVPSNTMAFGRLEGDDPDSLKGVTINGFLEFKEVSLNPEVAGWNTIDTYSINGRFYRLSGCKNKSLATCLLVSSDGDTWSENGPVIRASRFSHPHFIVWSKQHESGGAFDPKKYVYAASYAGLIGGQDQYLIARAALQSLSALKPTDWTFLQKDYSWSGIEGASPIRKSPDLGPDGANWKTTNTYSIDGVLYMFITRCIYPFNSSDPKRRHTWFNSSIIKSTNGGRTWSRSPQENYDRPMFPGRRFGAPYFVWYGKDGAATVDNADKFVYAFSNDGFFENGDDYVIGRVARSKLGDLSGTDWSFYAGGDAMSDTAWSAHLEQARPILKNPGKASMTGMTYLEGLRRYVLVSWHYNQANFAAGIKARDLSTVLEFFEAPQPWGPWSRVKRLETGKLGWYTPIVGQRFQTVASDGAARSFLYATGFFTDPGGGLDMSLYKMNYMPVTFSTSPLSHGDPAFVGGR